MPTQAPSRRAAQGSSLSRPRRSRRAAEYDACCFSPYASFSALQISPEDLGIWSDAHVEPLKRVAGIIKRYGSVPAIQLAHAGQKASTKRPWSQEHGASTLVDAANGGWEPVAASAVSFDGGKAYAVPHELTLAQIEEVQQAFVAAAKRALAAGFELIELHGAHGYLINNFLSPLTNKRTDTYGGSFANRTRFLLETVKRVRDPAVWPAHLPLVVRISAHEWNEHGWSVDESVELAKQLKELGVDAIDVSTGGNAPVAQFKVYSGYQVPFAQTIKEKAGIAVFAVGLIREPTHANEIVVAERADLVLLARELLHNPHWPIHAAEYFQVPTAPYVIHSQARAHGPSYPPKLPQF